ncbi:MAG: DegT/DnrJ/EryC1/StrS family aminotransferase [Ginsengibacter sp.]
MPPFEEYTSILKRAWNNGWITNNGELVQELEQKLKEYLGVKHLWLTSNGTVVLQMALKALNITKEVITTPFSYVATTNAILWEGCTPVFVDINANTCCVDARQIEAAITENTQAILLTHVYGFPCDVDMIESIAAKHNLKIIYDGAHAFGCNYKGQSLLSFGDISTCSFHATKLFHTVEGGCIICNDDELAEKLLHYRQFGHIGEEYFSIGINGKNSEFHAAMGLAVLPKMQQIIAKRKRVFELYNRLLNSNEISKPTLPKEISYNFSYYPVIFKSEVVLLKVKEALLQNEISARRYFYPSLNQLPFLDKYRPCEISESISRRVLTLPLYDDLTESDTRRIADIVNQQL